jgi:hypothetical protein
LFALGIKGFVAYFLGQIPLTKSIMIILLSLISRREISGAGLSDDNALDFYSGGGTLGILSFSWYY